MPHQVRSNEDQDAPHRHSARTQFRPGQSGNPGGRPKKDRDFAKLINAELDATVNVTEAGKKVKLTKRQVLAKTLVNDAAKGNLKAIEAVVRFAGLGAGIEEAMIDVNPQVVASFLARFPLKVDGEQK